jgi:predicted nuclease of predicted toxin-antitoxin system
VERSKLLGAPPKVICLRCGNTTPARIEILLRAHSDEIKKLSLQDGDSFIEIF